MSVIAHPTKNRRLPSPRHWYIVTYPEGRKGKKSYDPFEGTEAEAHAVDLAVRRSQRKTPLKVNMQLEQCIPDFIEWYATGRANSTIEAARRHMREFCRHMGKMPLTAISAASIEAYKRARVSAGRKPSTINNELIHLNTLMTWAAGENIIASASKCKLFPPKLTRSALPVMPMRSEFERIVAAVPDHLRGLFMLEFYAGLRRTESFTIAVENVFLDRGLLVVTGKGNKQRVVPIMYPPLLTELERKIKEVRTGWLWVNPKTGQHYRDLRKVLKQAVKDVGLDIRIYPHLLRHGFGTGAIEAGVSQKSLQELMGHSSQATTDIYIHLTAVHLIEEMKKMNPPNVDNNG